uniref:Transcription elongation factor SPT4 n=1 Tax=Panagrolaimus sp. PS1159 TaxID=55785 RepID=A0AC35GM12_9BILA
MDVLPTELRQLRACLVCSLIKTFEQFVRDGCDNCEPFLQMRNDSERVQEATSNSFNGMIGAMDNEASWVCKWQKINKKVPGCYAISVTGSLPSDLISELRSLKVTYVPSMRDRSKPHSVILLFG